MIDLVFARKRPLEKMGRNSYIGWALRATLEPRRPDLGSETKGETESKTKVKQDMKQEAKYGTQVSVLGARMPNF